MINKKRKKILKYNVKQIILIVLIFINVSFLVSVFGRYAIDNAKNFFSRSKEFYFFSDKLGEDNPVYQVDNWSGVENYEIVINMNSYANNLLKTSYDIPYEISFSEPYNAICQIEGEKNRVISSTTNTDVFKLTIIPNTVLQVGDIVSVEITATATSPYEKTIKGRFVLIVGREQLTYDIVDKVESPYLNVNITNTISFYTVSENFGTYNAGDQITRDVYLALSDEEKSKCYSKIVTIQFDPNKILLDMTNNAYINAIETTVTQIGQGTYINSVTFNIDALSSYNVRFYKVDELQDYTYPNVNNTPPIINLTSN